MCAGRQSEREPNSTHSSVPSAPASSSRYLLPDEIARTSVALYDSLPSHGKPLIRNNGVKEWTILATICLVQTPTNSNTGCGDSSSLGAQRIIPVSLGTGVKCLPYSKLSVHGDTLHDCHAEIIARRGFVRWLLYQARLLARRELMVANTREPELEAEAKDEELFVEWKEDGSFGLKKGLETWLYVSMLPCGDASTLYTAAHQSASEASQWVEADKAASNSASIPVSTSASTSTSNSSLASTSEPASITIPTPAARSIIVDRDVSSEAFAVSSAGSRSISISDPICDAIQGIPTTAVARGRNGYTSLSTLRTKPGRPDSIPSISMSCSDKLASYSVLGLQGALMTNLYHQPIYLDGIVIGGVDVADHFGEGDGDGSAVDEQAWRTRIKGEVERALWVRLEGMQGSLPRPYKLHRPFIHLTSIPFPHSKSSVSRKTEPSLALRSQSAADQEAETKPGPEPEPAPSPLSLSYLPSVHPIAIRSSRIPTLGATAHSKSKLKAKPMKAEILTDGGLLGYPRKKGQLMREKGRSRICKVEIYRAYQEVVDLMTSARVGDPGDGDVEDGFEHNSKHDRTMPNLTYYQVKHPLPLPIQVTGATVDISSAETHQNDSASIRENIRIRAVLAYQEAKRVLRGVPTPIPTGRPLKGLERFANEGLRSTEIPNISDDDAREEIYGDKRGDSDQDRGVDASTPPPPPPPFRGWLISGEKFESFDSAGTIIVPHPVEPN
ncbi:hypothetical protein IAT40_002063 [Kwoniella sp. CBS 6097]